MKIKINNLKLFLEHETSLEQLVAKKLRVNPSSIGQLQLLRKAVDARKKDNIYLNLHVLADIDVPAKYAKKLLLDKDISKWEEPKQMPPIFGTASLPGRVVVIGAGPAGLVAALELAKYGYRPLLIERGKTVAKRVEDVQSFWRTGVFNPDSNVQFGEGGAGTFSDGKLTTRVNDPVMAELLQTFVDAGAPENILWEHKPHVGTDKLRAMVQGLSKEIRRLGGEILYETQVQEFVTNDNAVTAVKLSNGATIKTGAVVLACGHSARDTYRMLYEKQIAIEAKPFAIGVRIEHPQELIDRAQYGKFAGHHLLGAADYALVYHTANKERTAYSFCMCPGGQVVAAASEAGGVVVNGMSLNARASGVANSALVVNVGVEDFGSHPLAGVEFQRKYEQLAFKAGGSSYYAPAQNFASFLAQGKPSLECLVKPTYEPGLVASDLDKVLPDYVTATLREGIVNFGRKIKGYDDGGALLTGIETRTSAPVRIPRQKDTYVSISHDLLYPCGEGAGYAGGIMSAALDGYHVARAIMQRFKVN